MIDFGLNEQALAVASYVTAGWQPEASWNGTEYMCRLRLRPWYNCRETGVVFQFVEGDNPYIGPALNIAVFEHRNHDGICAWMWLTRGVPDVQTADDIPEHIAPDKWTHDHSVGWGEAGAMASWVLRQFEHQYGQLGAALGRQATREATS